MVGFRRVPCSGNTSLCGSLLPFGTIHLILRADLLCKGILRIEPTLTPGANLAAGPVLVVADAEEINHRTLRMATPGVGQGTLLPTVPTHRDLPLAPLITVTRPRVLGASTVVLLGTGLTPVAAPDPDVPGPT